MVKNKLFSKLRMFCMEYVWKSSLWIGIFQTATQRARMLLTDNIQSGGSCSVNYFTSYCGISWRELDDIKLPVYKIDLNSSAFLLSCLSWGMKAAKFIFLQIFNLKGSFPWWRSMQLQNFSVTRHSGKWLPAMYSIVFWCLFVVLLFVCLFVCFFFGGGRGLYCVTTVTPFIEQTDTKTQWNILQVSLFYSFHLRKSKVQRYLAFADLRNIFLIQSILYNGRL